MTTRSALAVAFIAAEFGLMAAVVSGFGIAAALRTPGEERGPAPS